MKTRMVEQREGELLGPVDWSYDFDQHKWSDSRGGINPEIVDRGRNALIDLEYKIKQGKVCTVVCYGSRHRVISIGMYDGWPFWKPTPSVYIEFGLNGEWQPFYSISNVEEING